MKTNTADLAFIPAARKAFYASMSAVDLATHRHISKFAEIEIAFVAQLTKEPSSEQKNPRMGFRPAVI